jgi:hypothetical protein
LRREGKERGGKGEGEKWEVGEKRRGNCLTEEADFRK